MLPNAIHFLVELAPTLKKRGHHIPCFITLPGCKKHVVYVEPEYEHQVCRFCYQPGYTLPQCHRRELCHPREYEYDTERGITKVRTKVFMRPRPALWLSENVVGPIEMIAIQQRLQSRHRADRAREEERNRDFEVEAHFDPTEPTEKRIDVEEDHNPYMYHPSMDEWREVHQKKKPQTPPKTKPKQNTKPPNPQPPMETGEGTQTKKDPAKQTTRKRKGNPILIPENIEKGMTTDFSGRICVLPNRYKPRSSRELLEPNS
ncbi:hypothetical protein DSO57_1006955 [Entomophthora muscae]|uniref:Uncharacterized protein n=1 Tax=Entomophthora muscae TaxID=34485 RepID=A0ACC2TJ35_9FUNG|nr:hypothetical protein DSO57_1006955 [Entomophthora muscae]